MSEVKTVTYRVLSASEARAQAAARQAVQYVTAPVIVETDEEIIERLRERFQVLEDMTRAVKMGHARAMIVSGPPGVGKSHGIGKVLAHHDLMATIGGDDKFRKFEIIKGAMSSVHIYMKLFEFADQRDVIVFDDVTFEDSDGLNCLKAALDTGKRRTIHWNKESRVLRDAGIPNSFDFHGGVIFVTNLKSDDIRGRKLRAHMAALEDRCHYLDLTINTTREIMLRIRQVVADGMLDSYGLPDGAADELVEFVAENQNKMRELSLRTLIKLVELYKSMPDTWQGVAKVTLMK